MINDGRPIVLVGLPGSGKSTTGQRLARQLGVPFVDADRVFEERQASSIVAFFERYGEDSFREAEAALLQELVARHDGVLATGGGVVIRPSNRLVLRDVARVVYLHASAEHLLRRVRRDTSRPLLQVDNVRQRLRELYAERDSMYREVATCIVDTDRLTVGNLAAHVIRELAL